MTTTVGDTARLFVAIPVSPDVMTATLELISQCRGTGADVRWLKEESIHLTLLFLGDVAKGDIDTVGDALRESIRGTGPFTVECRGIGAFPSLRNPRVWWMGIDRSEALADLAGAVRKKLAGFGTGGDSRGAFRPHLTLGRVRSSRGSRQLRDVLEPMTDRSFGVIAVNTVTLMQSTLQPQGAVHRVCRALPLVAEEHDVK